MYPADISDYCLPGILLCLGEEIHRKPSIYCPGEGQEQGLVRETFEGPGLSGAIIHHGTYYSQASKYDPKSGVGLAIDGWVVPNSRADIQDPLSHLIESYQKAGIQFIETLNGAFTIVIWDSRSKLAHFANDRYGLRPVCYTTHAGNHYFAPQTEHILKLANLSGELNEQALINLLTYSRVWAGTDTLFRNINMLPPATIVTYSEGRVSQRTYWDYTFNPVSKVSDSFVDRFAATFQNAVDKHLKPWDSTGLNLSGGLDSRAVAAALSSPVKDKTRSFTWGHSNQCQEVQLARQTAEVFGIPWEYLKLEPQDFLKYAALGVRLLDGRDLACQSYALKIFPELASQCSVATSGLAFDLLCGGSYSSSILKQNSNVDCTGKNLTDSFIAGLLYFSDAHFDKMFLNHQQASHYRNNIKEQLYDDFTSGDITGTADAADRFFLRQRVWRYTFSRQQWQRFFLEDPAPTFDNDVIDLLLKIPATERANHKFFCRFLAYLDAKSLDIPYQRTLIPPSAPHHFWKEAIRLESSREELFRRIFYETNGRVYIPYDRYYSNFDEWLRVDKEWIKNTSDLLLSSECILGKLFLNPEWINQLLSEQMSGAKAHYSKIIVLITAELILRSFFKNTK
jgi:asparagine synthetase B (glutamine-hydrolysing)